MSKYHINDPIELKEVLFNDYQLIKKMRSPQSNKIKLLSSLFSINPNSWRVIGITPAALKVFNHHEFKKKSGMGINRSHIVQRSKFYNELLNTNFLTAEDLWEKYYANDITILATSTENMKNSVDLLKIYHPIPADDRNLFRTAGFAWKHKDEEVIFLKELFIEQS